MRSNLKLIKLVCMKLMYKMIKRFSLPFMMNAPNFVRMCKTKLYSLKRSDKP